ncbi:uncharacterized protein LOC125553139 [Triticum urartu]|uniref:Uncharacterized protein n=1 Tax=Triticum urartu TaxID=4572 RepID=A0A8R7Q734_TRIUA|nr:uncharacterized protein LOC125553136 [Triticum urartu]XP_048572881.1 uncharacterized protein LOC125553139 [Triticum urartu]
MARHGGGGGSGSCTSKASLARYIPRALRGRKKQQPYLMGGRRRAPDGYAASVELSASAGSTWPADSVVRVVLWSGIVEVYAGVVLACAVVGNHPPGLCLAHPDVFRNPHGATVRPLEPLFPGQKVLLLPETTVRRLQRDIPEGSVGANPDHDDREDEDAAASSTDDADTDADMSSSSWSGEEREATPEGCCARDFFVNREFWAEWQFKRMVDRGLAVKKEGAARPAKKDKKRRRKTKQTDGTPDAAAGTGCRNSGRISQAQKWTRPWEPSLPSVDEDEEDATPPSTPSSEAAARTDHETA